MPDIAGPRLAELIAGADPGTRVLYISGYAGAALARLVTDAGDVDLLEKPFGTRQLLARVRGALDRDVDAG